MRRALDGVRAYGRGVLALLALGAALALAGCAAGNVPAITSEADRLREARAALEREQYALAGELLRTYIAYNQGSAEVDEAIHLLGESLLGSKEWAMAAVEFERVLRDYPESDSAAASAFGLGEAYWGQARGPDFDQEFTVKALEQWQRYRRLHPGHWRAARADERILGARTRLATKLVHTGELYVRLRKDGPAREYFQRVLDEFGDTAVAAEARLGLARIEGRSGDRAAAVEALRALEAAHPGTELAREAARERRRLEH